MSFGSFCATIAAPTSIAAVVDVAAVAIVVVDAAAVFAIIVDVAVTDVVVLIKPPQIQFLAGTTSDSFDVVKNVLSQLLKASF